MLTGSAPKRRADFSPYAINMKWTGNTGATTVKSWTL